MTNGTASDTSGLNEILKDFGAGSAPPTPVQPGSQPQPGEPPVSPEPSAPPAEPVAPAPGADPTPAPVEPAPAEPAPTPATPAEPVQPAAPAAPAVPPEPTEPTEIEILKAQNAELMAMIRAQSAEPAQPAPGQPAPGQPATPVEEVFQFVKVDDDIDAVLKSADSFNKFASGLVYKAVEQALMRLPDVVIPMARSQVAYMTSIQDFYRANPDLYQYKEYCGAVANELASKDPSLQLTKLLENTEKEVRSRLKLKKAALDGGTAPARPPGPAASASPDAPPANPGFVPSGPGGRPRPAPASQTTGVSQEILDLADL